MVDFRDLTRDDESEQEEKKQEQKQDKKYVYVPQVKYSKLGKSIAFLFFIGLAGALGMWYFYADNQSVITVTMILGGGFYVPLGLILGKFFLDPKMRVKTLRTITRKNLGLINFVSRGRQIKTLMRDLDNDFVWIGEKVWHISNSKIYWFDESGIEDDKEIKQDQYYSANGVPLLFIDIDNLTPLTFGDTQTSNKPQQLGSSMKGWAANQLAKNALTSKGFQAGVFLAVVAAAAAAAFSFFGWQNSEQILEILQNTNFGSGISTSQIEQAVRTVVQGGGSGGS